MAVITGTSKDALYFRWRGEIASDGGIHQCDGRKLCGDDPRCDKHQGDSEQQLCGLPEQGVLQY
jgi:hypothetical protein